MFAQNESFNNSTAIMSPSMTVFFYCLYATVFSLALFGNTLSLITCYRSYKDIKSVLPCFIASLASADLLFTLLSIFDLLAFISDGELVWGKRNLQSTELSHRILLHRVHFDADCHQPREITCSVVSVVSSR